MNVHRRKALFVLSLCFASCGTGMVAARCDVFPYTVLRDACGAARAYLQVYLGQHKLIDDTLRGPTVRKQLDVVDDQLFLVAGGIDYLAEQSSTGHTLAWIMDRSGQIHHVWEYDPDIWKDLQQVTAAPLKSEVFPVGLHLFENGDLLVNFQGLNCWPYGIGLARFDKDSRLLWKKELINHHWFSVGEDGRIYTAAMRIIDSPVRMGSSESEIISEDGKITEDLVLILDEDGNVLEEISMPEVLVDSGWTGLFQGATDDNIHALTGDPTHLNDVRVITPKLAERHALLTAGDLLVSFRSLNAIGILDGQTKRFKWMCAGAFVRQHSPRIVDNQILLLDNRGGPLVTGGSRLVKIDLETRLPSTVFPHPQAAFENPFFTDVGGHLDLQSPDRVLVTLTSRSEIWEVDLHTGDVLWEYVYVDAKDRQRRPLYTAKYVQNKLFELNRNKEKHP